MRTGQEEALATTLNRLPNLQEGEELRSSLTEEEGSSRLLKSQSEEGTEELVDGLQGGGGADLEPYDKVADWRVREVRTRTGRW